MPVIDLGSVVGPAGPQGATGATGATGLQGNPGPNQVTNQTSTNLSGVLFGSQSKVTVKPVDTTGATEGGTNLISSGAVYTALAPKANQTELGYYEESNIATRAYEINEHISLYGNFYKVTAPIAVGETIANGTNCVRTTVGENLGRYVLLYTNSNPGQSFSTQNIGISGMSGYDFLLIEYRVKSDGAIYDYAILPTRNNAVAGPMHLYWAGTSAISVGYRTFTATNNAVTVGSGYRRGLSDSSATADDGYMIPVRIYGVKV